MISGLWQKSQKAFAAGDTAAGNALRSRADRLAKTPGVLKPSAAGSQMKGGLLGRGSEGVVTAVADPQYGLAARKLYDPRGMSSAELIRRKDVAGKAIGKSEDVAGYFGQRATPAGGGQMQFNELIPRGPAPKVNRPAGGIGPVHRPTYDDAIKASPDYDAAKERIRQTYGKAGFGDAQDVRAANMVRDPRSGKLRAVDVIPAREGEFLSQADRKLLNYRENQLGAYEGGEKLFNPNQAQYPSQELATGTMKSSLLSKPVGPAQVPTPAGSLARGTQAGEVVRPNMTQATAVQRKARVPAASAAAPATSVLRKKKPIGPAAAMAPKMPAQPRI